MNNGSTDEVQIDLIRALKAALRKWPFILCIACITSCFAYIYYHKTNSLYYTSYGKIYVIDKERTGITLSIEDLDIGSQLVEDYKELIKSRFVLEKVIKKLGLDITYEDLLECVNVESPIDTRIIEIEINFEDRVKTQHILNAIEYVTSNELADKLGTEHPTILEKACEPKEHYKFSPMVQGIIVFLVMSFLMSGAIAFADIMNNRIRYKEDVTKILNIDLLATVPYVPSGFYSKNK